MGIEPKASPLVLQTSSVDEQEAARLLDEVCVQQSAGEDDRPLVMIHPGARYWFKAWASERFAELADRLNEVLNCRVLVGGDARDREAAEGIRARARSTPLVLAGRTSLLEFAAALKRCALFIGNDNGPMHMAAALGLSVIGLFGSSDPAVWGPRGDGHRIFYKGLGCRDCFHPDCFRGEQNCMRLITLDEVWQAVRDRLGGWTCRR